MINNSTWRHPNETQVPCSAFVALPSSCVSSSAHTCIQYFRNLSVHFKPMVRISKDSGHCSTKALYCQKMPKKHRHGWTIFMICNALPPIETNFLHCDQDAKCLSIGALVLVNRVPKTLATCSPQTSLLEVRTGPDRAKMNESSSIKYRQNKMEKIWKYMKIVEICGNRLNILRFFQKEWKPTFQQLSPGTGKPRLQQKASICI